MEWRFGGLRGSQKLPCAHFARCSRCMHMATSTCRNSSTLTEVNIVSVSDRLSHHCCHHFAGYQFAARQPGNQVSRDSRGQLHTLQVLRPQSNELRDMKEGGNASRWMQDGEQRQPRRIRRSLKQTSSQQKVCMRGDHSCRHLGRQQQNS